MRFRYNTVYFLPTLIKITTTTITITTITITTTIIVIISHLFKLDRSKNS